MRSRIISLIFRVVLAVWLLWAATQLADALDGVAVTAPGLILFVAATASCALVLPGLWRLVKRDRFSPPLSVSATTEGGGTVVVALPALAQDRKDRARHEAAHAVAVHALGHQLMRLSIRALGNSGGRTAWRHRDGVLASVDHVTVSFAGPLADGRRIPSKPLADGGDDQSRMLYDAIDASIADAQGRSPVEIIDIGTRKARHIIVEHEKAIDDLAQLLVDTEEKRDLQADELAAFMQTHNVTPMDHEQR